MTKDYNEVLLESIQTLIDASLNRLSQDRTEVCSIVDNSEAKSAHKYKVTPDGSIIYEAYADLTTYAIDEQVIVLIPQQDTDRRTILSRYITDEVEQAEVFVSPLEKMIQVEQTSGTRQYSHGNFTTEQSTMTFIQSNQDNIAAITFTNISNGTATLGIKITDVNEKTLYSNYSNTIASKSKLRFDLTQYPNWNQVVFTKAPNNWNLEWISETNNMQIEAKSNAEKTLSSHILIAPVNPEIVLPPLTNMLHLKAKFTTNFDLQEAMAMQSGNYGLIIVGKDSNGNIIDKWAFDSSAMFGNPYLFDGGFEQEFVIYNNQELLSQIAVFELQLYQLGNFKTVEEKNISDIFNTITAEDITITLGIDVESVADNTVVIWTNDSQRYTPNTMASPQANIYLTFYNKDENNQYLGFGLWDSIEAKKHRGTVTRVIETPPREEDTEGQTYYTYEVDEKYSYYVKDEPLTLKDKPLQVTDKVYYFFENSAFTIEHDESKKITAVIEGRYNWIDWYGTNKNGIVELLNSNEENPMIEYLLDLHDTLREQKIYAVVWENGESYTSDDLIFTNQNALNKEAMSLAGVKMSIEHGNNSQPAYAFYDGMTNALLTPGEATRPRYLKFNWITDPGYALETEFWDGAHMRWYLPKHSMLQPSAETTNEGTDSQPKWNALENTEYYVYDDTIIYDSTDKRLKGTTCTYNISNNYLSNLTNNTIKCEVVVEVNPNDETAGTKTLTGEISFGFSTFGSSGTDYTIVFTETDNIITATAVDKDGQSVVDKEGKSIAKVRWMDNTHWEESLFLAGRSIATYNLIEARAQVSHAGQNVWIYGYHSYIIGKKDVIVPTSIMYKNTGTDPMYYRGDWSPNAGDWRIRYYNGYTTNSEPRQFSTAAYDTIAATDTDYPRWIWVPELRKEGEFAEHFEYSTDTKNWISAASYENIELEPNITYYVSGYLGTNDEEQERSYTLYWKIPVNTTDIQQNDGSLPYFNPSQEFCVPPMYIESNVHCALELIGVNNEAAANIPIYIGIQRHASELFNNWDGSMVIDNEGNYLLASMVGAGRKNDDNTFSGVVMGERAKTQEGTNDIGLFGYYHGKNSFNFNINGTATLGVPGQGQIKIDGNSGTIASPGWKKDISTNDKWEREKGYSAAGSAWDLDDGDFILQANDNEYIKFEDGELDIKVKKLSIESATTGKNLLRNTEPQVNLIDGWNWTVDSGFAVDKIDNKICLVITGTNAKPGFLQQTFHNYVNYSYYSLSYDLLKVGTNGLTIQYKKDTSDTWNDIVTVTTTGYHTHEVKLPEGDITLRFCGGDSALYHLKLEYGVNATPWEPHEEDKKPQRGNLLNNTLPAETANYYYNTLNQWTSNGVIFIQNKTQNTQAKNILFKTKTNLSGELLVTNVEYPQIIKSIDFIDATYDESGSEFRNHPVTIDILAGNTFALVGRVTLNGESQTNTWSNISEIPMNIQYMSFAADRDIGNQVTISVEYNTPADTITPTHTALNNSAIYTYSYYPIKSDNSLGKVYSVTKLGKDWMDEDFEIQYNGDTLVGFTQPMLQEGWEVTTWQSNGIDVALSAALESEAYVTGMSYLTQDVVFQKLTGGPMIDNKGIWLTDDGELYINASMMAGEVLRSSNWTGELEYIHNKNDPTGETTSVTPENLDELIKQYPNGCLHQDMTQIESGSLWDLNSGAFYLKDSSGQHLIFDQGGLDIAVNKLSITSPTTGINLLRNSEPKSSIEGWILSTNATPVFQDNKYGYQLGNVYSTAAGGPFSPYIRQRFMSAEKTYYTLSFDQLLDGDGSCSISVKKTASDDSITVESTTNDNKQIFYFYSDTAEDLTIAIVGTNCFIYHPKLETGTQATSWVPHAEDKEPLDINLLQNTMPSEGPGFYKQLQGWQTFPTDVYVNIVEGDAKGYDFYTYQKSGKLRDPISGLTNWVLRPEPISITVTAGKEYALHFNSINTEDIIIYYQPRYPEAMLNWIPYITISPKQFAKTPYWFIPSDLINQNGIISIVVNSLNKKDITQEDITYEIIELNFTTTESIQPEYKVYQNDIFTFTYYIYDSQEGRWRLKTDAYHLGSQINKFGLPMTGTFREAKLQPGLIATDWREVDRDSSLAAIQSSVQASANYTRGLEYLNQQNVFAKLTNGGEQQGIFLNDGKLYINSEMIAAGLIQSQNWNGNLKYVVDDNTKVDIRNDGNGPTLDAAQVNKLGVKNYTELIAKYPNGHWTFDMSTISKGSFWDLNNGNFYLKNNNGHLIFNDGGLDIKVRDLEITSNSQFTNLLRGTSTADLNVTNQSGTKYWSLYGTSDGYSIDKYPNSDTVYRVKIFKSDSVQQQGWPGYHGWAAAYYNISDLADGDYTLSFEIGHNRTNMAPTCSQGLVTCYSMNSIGTGWPTNDAHSKTFDIGQIPTSYDNTTRYSFTFKKITTSTNNQKNSRYICIFFRLGFDSQWKGTEASSYYEFILRRLKLEQNTHATQWVASPHDVPLQIAYDNSEGFYMSNGRLYINASQIQTGVLASANWHQTGGRIEDDGNIVAHGSSGSAFSLQSGMISANELRIGTPGVSNISLYLNTASGFSGYYKNNDIPLFSFTNNAHTLTSPSYEYVPSETTQQQPQYGYHKVKAQRSPLMSNGFRKESPTGTSQKTQFTKDTTYFLLKQYTPQENTDLALYDGYPNWYPVICNMNYEPITNENELPNTLDDVKRAYVYNPIQTPSSGNLFSYSLTTAKIRTKSVTVSSTSPQSNQLYLDTTEQYNIGGHLIIAKKGNNGQSIMIGNAPNSEDYALQIGNFKVKWDGTVQQS